MRDRRMWLIVLLLLLLMFRRHHRGTQDAPLLVGPDANIDAQVDMTDFRPGDALHFEKSTGDSASFRFQMEGPKRDQPLLIGSYTPYKQKQQEVQANLCDNCQPVELIPGIFITWQQGRVSVRYDEPWYRSQATHVDMNLVGWMTDGTWAVIHVPNGDFWFRETARESNSADTDKVTYQVILPGETVPKTYTTEDGMHFGTDAGIHPVDKFIVAPVEWYYEEGVSPPKS